ncbi:hypothetical protein EGW08_011775, partial [Elysia chlorotica]
MSMLSHSSGASSKFSGRDTKVLRNVNENKGNVKSTEEDGNQQGRPISSTISDQVEASVPTSQTNAGAEILTGPPQVPTEFELHDSSAAGVGQSELHGCRAGASPGPELYSGSPASRSRWRGVRLNSLPSGSDDSEQEDGGNSIANARDEESSEEAPSVASGVGLHQVDKGLQDRRYERIAKPRHPHTIVGPSLKGPKAYFSIESMIHQYNCMPGTRSFFSNVQQRNLSVSLSDVELGEELESDKASWNQHFPSTRSGRVVEKPPCVTTFHQYYFKPAVLCAPETETWGQPTSERGEFRFLRNARYLDKMVREYGLDEFVVQNKGKTPQLFQSNLIINMHRRLEQCKRTFRMLEQGSHDKHSSVKEHVKDVDDRGTLTEMSISSSTASERFQDLDSLSSFSSICTNSTIDMHQNQSSFVSKTRKFFQVIVVYLSFLVASFKKCFLCQCSQSTRSPRPCSRSCCKVRRENDLSRSRPEALGSSQSIDFLPTEPCYFAQTQLADPQQIERHQRAHSKSNLKGKQQADDCCNDIHSQYISNRLNNLFKPSKERKHPNFEDSEPFTSFTDGSKGLNRDGICSMFLNDQEVVNLKDSPSTGLEVRPGDKMDEHVREAFNHFTQNDNNTSTLTHSLKSRYEEDETLEAQPSCSLSASDRPGNMANIDKPRPFIAEASPAAENSGAGTPSVSGTKSETKREPNQ